MRRVLIVFVVCITLGATALILWYTKAVPSIPFISRVPVVDPLAKPIARIGDEVLYQQDIDYETQRLRQTGGQQPDRETLLRRLRNHSAIIQEGAKRKLVVTTTEIYNSPKKDMIRRVETVRELEKTLDQEDAQVAGSIMSFWFYNNTIGPLGYVEAKKRALSTAQEYYADVSSGKLTIKQAADLYLADPDLLILDPYAGKNNVYTTFRGKKGDQVTFDTTFNSVIFSTKAETLTPLSVLSGQAFELNAPSPKRSTMELVYAFAYIDTNTMEKQSLQEIMDTYEIEPL